MTAESCSHGSNYARLYRLGVRLRELELLIGFANDPSELTTSCRFVRFVDDDIRAVDFDPSLRWRIDQAKDRLQKVHADLLALSDWPSDEWQFEGEPAIRDVVEINNVIADSLVGEGAAWFQLGRAIVPQPNWELFSSSSAELNPRDIMEWRAEPQPDLDHWLMTTGSNLRELLVPPDSDNPDWSNHLGQFPEPLWPLNWVERGLQDIANIQAAQTAGRSSVAEQPIQPASDKTPRNLYFLRWYLDEAATTYHSPARIRDRWNESYPRFKIREKRKGNGCARRSLGPNPSRKTARPKMDTGMQAWLNGSVRFLIAANRG